MTAERLTPAQLAAGITLDHDGMAWVPDAGGGESLVPLAELPTAPECPKAGTFSHNSFGCLTCQRRARWVRAALDAEEEEQRAASLTSQRVSGGFLFELPTEDAIWGTPETLLAADGQGWMIVGPDGTGKTSAACQYVKARLALDGWGGEMWGLSVKPLPESQTVYYLAMDRPRQMMKAFRRGLGPEHREEVDRRLFVHRGPPPYRLAHEAGQDWMLREVEETRAGMVVFDSRKDLGNTLDAESVNGVAQAIQMLVAADVEVLVLAHPTKGRRNGPPTLEDVSGHREVFSGLGSVVFLDGRPGSEFVDVHHVKPIHEVVPAFKIAHDHRLGRSDVWEGIAPEGDDLTEGRAPVDAYEVRVLACIDAHPDGEAPAGSLKEVLGSGNLARDLKYLIERGVIEHNGKRAAQSGYRRGPNAPPRA